MHAAAGSKNETLYKLPRPLAEYLAHIVVPFITIPHPYGSRTRLVLRVVEVFITRD